MKLMPFSSLSQPTQRVVSKYMADNELFIPGCYFDLDLSISYQYFHSMMRWSKDSHIPIFISILTNIIVFENEDNAVLFKLAWVDTLNESK